MAEKKRYEEENRSKLSRTSILEHNFDMFRIKIMDPEKYWKKSDIIGFGSFGKIFKCTNVEDDKLAAMKILNIDEDLALDQLLIELEIMNKSNHKNIVQFYDAFMHNDKIYIIMEYCALEVINCSFHKFTKYNYKADIWSLGITCIELAEKQPPNTSLKPKDAMKMIKNEKSPKLKEPNEWSEFFQDFIAQCLVKNPKVRPNASHLLQDLYYGW
ncbi:Serine threonine- kinase [Brachionus plicatilis]|uniref:Serine threonine-kinase n=1 Tax=Brachionus plicatilis TaxID=10195 RepID=A0A3M7S0B1_BRAPC|nr:Serine threonine- kinase [Brachionus plicatilis]